MSALRGDLCTGNKEDSAFRSLRLPKHESDNRNVNRNASLETRNTVIIVTVVNKLALPLENVVARGVADGGCGFVIGDMLYEVLHLQVWRRGEHRRKNGRLSSAWILEQGFSGGIIFKRLPMLVAQKSPKKPVHDPDPILGLVVPARVNTVSAFPVHRDAPCTHLFRIQIQVSRQIAIREHVF